jgi:adenine-specific DNA-methyltransferase
MNHPVATVEKVAAASGDVLEVQLERLRSLFPDVFVEGKVDFDKLRATLGAAVESGPGRFHFSWAGKDDCIQLLQTPSRATLVPCPEESIHFETTGNVFIEGDNLEVLKLLFKPYFGRVKLIYIDPPYNTGQDFVYPDNYADPLRTYLQLTGQADAEGNLLTSNPETSGRYHSAWLSMMYPRLFLARQLLRDDGVICVSIDDHEVHHLRMLMNEVFGEENLLCCMVWKRRQVSDNRNINNISTDHEYIIAYGRDDSRFRGEAKDLSKYSNPDDDPRGPWMSDNMTGLANRTERPNLHYDLINPETGVSYPPSPSRGWVYEPSTMARLIEEKRILWPANSTGRPRLKRFLNDIRSQFTGFSSILDVGYTTDGTREIESLFGRKLLAFPKPVSLIRSLCEQTTTKSDIIVDFFAGSCTTAHAVLETNRDDGGNRKFIMVQLPEPTENVELATIAEIGKERIRRVIAKLQKDAKESLDLKDRETPEDLGFKVFKLAPPNIQPWTGGGEREPEAYAQKLAAFNDPLVPGWTAENLLWEIALREGYSLNTRFAPRELAGNTVWEVADPDTGQALLVCLDDEIRGDFNRHCELAPDLILVCRDKALDDTAAANLALQCRLKTI